MRVHCRRGNMVTYVILAASIASVMMISSTQALIETSEQVRDQMNRQQIELLVESARGLPAGVLSLNGEGWSLSVKPLSGQKIEVAARSVDHHTTVTLERR